MYSCFRSLSPTVTTIRTRKRCKYHKRKNQMYRQEDLCGQFCLDAFYIAYPYCLALLYNCISDVFEINCPSLTGVKMRIERIPRSWFRSRRALKWILGKILFPIDWADWQIKISVTEEGNCPYLKIHDAINFNLNDPKILCPASFHTIFPRMRGEICCPDERGQIYHIR